MAFRVPRYSFANDKAHNPLSLSSSALLPLLELSYTFLAREAHEKIPYRSDRSALRRTCPIPSSDNVAVIYFRKHPAIVLRRY